MLVQTPILQVSLNTIALNFIDTIMSGKNITKDNIETLPQQTAIQAAQQFSTDLSNALDTWFSGTILHIPPSGTETTGGPNSQVSVNDAIVLKV